MSQKHLIAIDLGATSGRVILATIDGQRIGLEELNRFPTRMIRLFGRYYWDIYALFGHICDGLRDAARKGVAIDSIGIDTWGVDMAFVGRDGQLLGLPRAYRDPYTDGTPEEFFRTVPRREVYDRTGIQIMNFNTLYQLAAARRERCDALMAADKLLFIPDALAYLLTGRMVCEYTILSTSQLMDPRGKRLDAKLLAAAGVRPEQFPGIVFPGEIVGHLSAEIAEATGLGPVPVIAVAGHDTASAVAAVPASDERFAYLSSGTWSLMGIEVREPVITDESFRLNFSNEGGVEGTTRLLKNITGMWLLEQCRAAWKARGRDYSYPEIVAMTSAAEPFAAWIDPDDARFAAPTDMEAAIRAYCRETGQTEPADDAALMRCIFESLALKYREVLDKLRRLAPFPLQTLHVIGGGAQNDLLNRMTASATGVPVVAGPSEATALGNVLVQARALGLAADLKDMRRLAAESVATRRFEPEESARWQAAYDAYERITQQA
ncbi:rhamnulokinase [Alistipes sp.]|uniref:rhamnulokinase n=1 Tax=Alistipes sp. TaxID=1872444 RepID=UPI003AF13DB3